MPEVSSPVGAVARRAQAQAARANEPKSWGEAVRKYDASRHEPAHPALLSPVPPSKHGVYNAVIKPPEFHPLRQEYTNPSREQQTKQQEKEKERTHVERAQWKVDHLANAKGFHVLTGMLQSTTNTELSQKLQKEDNKHRTKVATLPDGSRAISFTQPEHAPPARDYNILTNKTTFEGSAERLAKAEAKAVPLHNRSAKEAREYNILTNKYQYENHAARAERERLVNESRLREKYFASAHYNPVTMQFVHPQEEARYQLAKAQASAQHGQGQLANLPPRIKRSEGQCYDILAPGVVKNPLQLAESYDKPAQAARETRQSKHEVERGVATRDLTLDQQSANRSSNRVSTKRYEEQVSRGHDIVSNQPYEGRERKQLFKPSAMNQNVQQGTQ